VVEGTLGRLEVRHLLRKNRQRRRDIPLESTLVLYLFFQLLQGYIYSSSVELTDLANTGLIMQVISAATAFVLALENFERKQKEIGHRYHLAVL
jgi:hypothetical protein